MIKKFSAIFLSILLIASCSTSTDERISVKGVRYSGFSSGLNDFEGFKVAALLPLSGKAAKQGEGLQNAAMLALSESNNDKLVLDFFDTQSTADGALIAARSAAAKGADLIIGPLTSDEVWAITPLARSNGLPVVSFSTSKSVLQKGIYTMGILADEQIQKIVEYASKKGRERFAIIVPDNNYGMRMARSAYIATRRSGVVLVKIGFYDPETIDFSQLLKEMTNYGSRSAQMEKMKSDAQKRLDEGDVSAAEELSRLKKYDSYGDVDFDAIIIPEGGIKLKSAASMLGYYDVFSPKVMFLGTTVWDNTNLSKETTLYGAVYPAPSKQSAGHFPDSYKELYGQYPEMLYTVAYDAVALASALSKSKYSVNDALLSDDVFSGLNGEVRFYADGTNKHNLKIFEITEKGPKEVFENSYQFFAENERFGFATLETPQVYGKDEAEVIRYIMSDE